MKKSTKHGLAMRFLALLGVSPMISPYFGVDLYSVPIGIVIFCMLVASFAVISGFGIGPWGRYYNSLIVKEDEEYRTTLITKQPWER